MAVEFKDNSIEVKGAINDAMYAFLEEASGEIEAQTKQNVPVGGSYFSQQKAAWEHIVDETEGKAYVGNPMQQAIWTEFGTGEFALNGDGRKGYWVYVAGTDLSEASTGGDSYTLEEAKKIVAIMRSQGIDAHYTHGQTPKRPLFSAFESLKGTIQKRAQAIMNERLN